MFFKQTHISSLRQMCQEGTWVTEPQSPAIQHSEAREPWRQTHTMAIEAYQAKSILINYSNKEKLQQFYCNHRLSKERQD